MMSGDAARDPVAAARQPIVTATPPGEKREGVVCHIGGIARLAGHLLSLVCFIMAFHKEYQRDLGK